MDTTSRPILTPRDFALLETMLAGHADGDDRLAAAIRRKQERCRVFYSDILPNDVVTIGSRFRYAINDRPPRECRLVEPQHYVPGQGCQSLASLRGIAMLGLSAGSRVGVDLGTRVETLEILETLYQPQVIARAGRVTSPAEASFRPIGSEIAGPASTTHFDEGQKVTSELATDKRAGKDVTGQLSITT